MHLAAERAHMDIVKYLVRKGADVNIKDDNGVNMHDYSNDTSTVDLSYPCIVDDPVLLILFYCLQEEFVSLNTLVDPQSCIQGRRIPPFLHTTILLHNLHRSLNHTPTYQFSL